MALDLLNCTSVQSAPSPTHPSARDDVGTFAARLQSSERDGQPLMDMLVPFHMLYADGVERLAAESLLERQKWVNRLWYVTVTLVVHQILTFFFSHTGRRSTVPLPCLNLHPLLALPLDLSGRFYPLTAEAAIQALAPVRPSLYPPSALSQTSQMCSPANLLTAQDSLVTRPLYLHTTLAQ